MVKPGPALPGQIVVEEAGNAGELDSAQEPPGGDQNAMGAARCPAALVLRQMHQEPLFM
jgi:hypothetical protein